MSRQEQIERMYNLVKTFKNGYDVTDDYGEALEGLITELVDQGIGDKDRFEVDCKIRDEFANWIGVRPIDYKEEG